MRAQAAANALGSSTQEFSTITLPIETPLRLTSNNLVKNNCNNSGDLASLDSSDTYASCQTHPFLSQGDLTGELADISCTLAEFEIDDLYISRLDKDRQKALSSTLTNDSMIKSQIKKSASGDASAHSLVGGAPMEEIFKTFQSFDMGISRTDRGSNISLNDPPIPKHRKTRFQKGSLNKPVALLSTATNTTTTATYTDASDSPATKKQSHDSLNEYQSPSTTTKKIRRSSFMPTKSLASATKLINQHLFGIQNPITRGILSYSRITKIKRIINFNFSFQAKSLTKSSHSQETGEFHEETHRRSKSILKNKSDSSKVLSDPESERLLSDSASGAAVSENGSVS